jgi:pimeloyl-ACP methyl ester carboxylesterase
VRRVLALGGALLAAGGGATGAEAAGFRTCDRFLEIECRHVRVPLDHGGSVPGSIRLYVERIRARERRRGVLVSLSGGPGAAGTGTTFIDQIVLAPLLKERDLVVFDQRGTGRSGRLRCAALDRRSWTRARVERCGRGLGPRRAFYRSLDSAEDIEVLRRALGVERIALYGVSYGTKVAQEYAYRHPDRLELLVLDSVLPLNGPDPFQREVFGALPRAYDAICARGCGWLDHRPYDRLARLVARTPVRGRVVDGRGRSHSTALDARDLYQLVVGTDVDPILHTMLPGAVESALAGDSAPILRLVRRAHRLSPGSTFSSGLFFATTCEEGDAPWDRRASPEERLAQARDAAAGVPESVFAPFPRSLVLRDTVRLCAPWPMTPTRPPLPDASPPEVPTLVLNGEQDLRTPVENAAAVASELPNARLATIPGAGHGALVGDIDGCARQALRAFVRGRPPSRCRPRPLLIRPPEPDPQRLHDLKPVGAPGRRGRTVAAVVATLDDALREAASGTGGRWVGGLRGGRLRLEGPFVRFRNVAYVPGVRLSGGLLFQALGRVRVRGPKAAHGELRVLGNRVRGRLGGRRIRARVKRDLDLVIFTDLGFDKRAAAVRKSLVP